MDKNIPLSDESLATVSAGEIKYVSFDKFVATAYGKKISDCSNAELLNYADRYGQVNFGRGVMQGESNKSGTKGSTFDMYNP